MGDARAAGSNRERGGRLARLGSLIDIALLLSGAATLLALLGDRWWGFELLTHFKPQLAAAQIAGVLYLGARRRSRLALLMLPFLAINAMAVAPYYWPARVEAASPAASGNRLRVMTLNLNAANDRVDLVEHVVTENDPDVILFAEATARWRDRLAGLSGKYPYLIGRSNRSPFSILMLSRVPLRDARILGLPFDHRPVIRAAACRDDAAPPTDCLILLGVHPPPPLGPDLAAERNSELAAIGNWARSQPTDRVAVVGDFNATPWSPMFRELLRVGQLRDGAMGFGPNATWLSRFPLFGLPIDHILVGRGVTVLDRRIGGYVGSDHYPVITDLAY